MGSRPTAQWVVGGVAALCLLFALVRWAMQLGRMLSGCGGGFGNPAVGGRLTSEFCVLSVPGTTVEVPWREDLRITAAVLIGLACLAAALLLRRRAVLLVSLAVLLYAGAVMAVRGRQRVDGFVDGLTAWGRVPEGWELYVPGHRLFVPDAGLASLGFTALAGVGVLVLVVLLQRDPGAWRRSPASSSDHERQWRA